MSAPMAMLVRVDGATSRSWGRLSIVAAGTVVESAIELEGVTRIRQAADQLAAAVDRAARDVGVRVTNAGRLVLVEGADDVAVNLDGDDIALLEVEVDPRTRLSSQTYGSRYRSSGLDAHDRETLDRLADMVGTLSRVAASENRLGRLALEALTTAGPASPLAMAAQQLLSGTAAATEVRTSQLDAIEQKEREAKGGPPGAAGAPPPPGGAVGPGGTGPTPAPPPGGGGGGAPGGGPGTGDTEPDGGEPTRPGEPAAPTDDLGRPAGSDEDPRPFKAPCQILTYIIDGIRITIGLFVGGEDGEGTWHLARGQYDLELFTPEGPEIIADSYDFGDEDAADPEARPLPIDKAVLDALVERRQQDLQQEQDPWADARSFVSFLADLTPVVGQVKSGVELLTGYDIIAGRELSTAELAVVGVGILLPFAGGALKASTKAVLSSTQRLIRSSQGAVELAGPQLRALDEALEAFRSARRARGKPRVIVQSKQCEKARPRSGRGGLSRIRIKCFPAGTPVRTDGGPRRAIEDVAPGGGVLRIARGAAAELVELALAGDDGHTAVLRPTPPHLMATTRGFVPAGELRRGDALRRSGGGVALVRDIRLLRGRWPVHNLTVVGDHTYCAGELDIVVHNSCDCTEFISQQTTEGILEQRGFQFLQKDGGFANTRNPSTFAPEPEFKLDADDVGTFTGRAGRQPNGTQIRNPALDSTRPDVYGIEDGVRVAYEIKTIPGNRTVEQFFTEYRDSITSQIGGRLQNMNGLGVEHRLIIDLRNIERFETFDRVLAHLRTLGRGDLQALTQYSGGVRFIQGGPGASTLSDIIPWSQILT